MDSEIEEDLSTPNSWIPIKALKKLMGTPSRGGSPSVTELDEMPNKSINISSSFEKLHNKYTSPPPSPPIHSNLRKLNPELYIKSLEKKLKACETETKLLKRKLKTTEMENSELNKLICKLKQEHMIRLQNIQEQHEKKLQKTKRDLDYLLKEMNNRSNLIILEDFIKIHMAEIEKCRSNYEEIIKTFLVQVSSQDTEKDYLKTISQGLELRLENELNSIKERYDYQIEMLKEIVTNESLEEFEDELSTRINSERATTELKESMLEHTMKIHTSPKNSFH